MSKINYKKLTKTTMKACITLAGKQAGRTMSRLLAIELITAQPFFGKITKFTIKWPDPQGKLK